MAGEERKVNRQAMRFTGAANFSWRKGQGNEDPAMLSFPEALNLLLRNCPSMPVESCRLENAAGRVLRAPVVADRAFPAFDRVMMDGYALRFSDWSAGHRSYQVTGSAPAGSAVSALSEEIGTCLEVMTGAPCPQWADCIIPVEEVETSDANSVKFSETADPVAGRFIHFAGSDATAGRILLELGQEIGARQIGVAASCGAAWLQVSKLPRIAVVATGDELVSVDASPEPHQIRQSNAHSLAAALTLAGYPPQHLGVVNDDVSATRPIFEKLLAEHDWLVLTGAVSKGAHDFVPSLLADLGCRKVFHGIAQRPGKPAGCWIGPRGQVVLALPGNPVSALTGLHTLLLPALAAASGLIPSAPRRIVMEDRTQQLPEFTRHLPVTIRADGRAEPAATGNSGDFIGLLKSDGFITLPPSGSSIAAFPYTPWR
jgi:molybdopterin molybdotransferase